MPYSAHDSLPCIEIAIPSDNAAPLEEFLAGVAPAGFSSYATPHTGCTVIRVWVPRDSSPEEVKARIKALLTESENWLGFPCPALQTVQVRQEDWAESWKRHFHTQRVSRRIVIKPSWEAFEAAAEDIVLELDPGMSFGTGQHETTKACLSMMDELSSALAPCPLLDAGCGSGILTMAAVRLGYHPILAFDHDPQAVLVAKENLSRAGLAETVEIRQADLNQVQPAGRFPLVVANILAPVLLANADILVGMLATAASSRLLLSGILDSQYAAIRQAFEARGLEEERRLRLGEWTSGCFRPRSQDGKSSPTRQSPNRQGV